MIALIDQYRKELLKVNCFAPSTVDTYTISIKGSRKNNFTFWHLIFRSFSAYFKEQKL